MEEDSLANTSIQVLHVGGQLRWFLAKDIEELGEDILRVAIPDARTFAHRSVR